MKTINVSFDDEDFEELVQTKGDLSWRAFILKLIKLEDEEE